MADDAHQRSRTSGSPRSSLVVIAVARGASWVIEWCTAHGLAWCGGDVVATAQRPRTRRQSGSALTVPVPLLAVVDASSAEHVLKAFQDGRRPAMLIVASDSDEAARALRLDIDDVIRAPFSREELGARLSRLVGPTTALLPFPPLLVDRGRCEVLASGKRVPLRRAEYELLMYLISQHPRVVDQREILREVFGTTGDGGAIRYHICTLRRKLLECGADIIRTVRGSGYYVEQQMNSSAEPSLGENRNVGLED